MVRYNCFPAMRSKNQGRLKPSFSKFIHPPAQTLLADSRTLNDTFMKIYVATRENISAHRRRKVLAELVLLQSAGKCKY